MRKGRLYNLMCHLLENEHSTAKDVSKKFGMAIRTVYRDIETLNSAGIPAYCETGRFGGICLTNGILRERAVLSQEDRMRILAELRAHADQYQEPTPMALQRLAEMFDIPEDEWMVPAYPRTEGELDPNDRIRSIRRAIVQRHCMIFTFSDNPDAHYRVRVRPLQLRCGDRGWTVMTYLPDAERYREYPLSHIFHWKATTEFFDAMDIPEDDGCGKPEKIVEKVVVKFPMDMIEEVYSVFDCTVARRRNGALEIRGDMVVDSALGDKLLGLGPRVLIKEPLRLREYVANKARDVWESYNK